MPLNADKGESEVAMQETQGIAPTAAEEKTAPTPVPTPSPAAPEPEKSQPTAERPPMPLNADKGESEVSMQETQGIAPLPSESLWPLPMQSQPVSSSPVTLSPILSSPLPSRRH